MKSTIIVNPRTHRQNRVRYWDINPKEIMTELDKGKTARDLSWALLSDDESFCKMIKTQDGDSAVSNWSLSVLENALDWSLGLTIIQFIRAAVKNRKFPKPFKVAVNKTGDVFVIGASGKVYNF